MSDDLDIPFDRITYRDGQLLTALDLRGDRQRDERLRWLHTRYLHATWGIALGLVVTKANTGKAVEIGPGYAVDSDGRDILLAETVQLAVPEVKEPEAFVLTAGYQEDRVFRERPDLAGLCLSGGLDPRHERPVFSWRRPDEVRFGPEVPLAQVGVARGILSGLDFRVRRNARPMVRPHMGWSSTEPGQTGWRRWQEAGRADFGIEVVVDTSEAGFTATPHYLASLEGDFGNQVQPDVWPTGTRRAFFLEGLTFITNALPESFTFRIIRVAELPWIEVPVSGAQAEERQWTVSWLGLEPVTGCEPRRDPRRIFSLSGIQIATRD